MFGNAMNCGVNFCGTYGQNPVPVIAKQFKTDFQVSSPWSDETLKGDAGDYLVTNTWTGETYPCSYDDMQKDYEHVEGFNYRKKVNGTKEAFLPDAKEIDTLEGRERTVGEDGLTAMLGVGLKKGVKKCYPINADYFLKAYFPIDDDAKKDFAKFQAINAAEKAAKASKTE